MRRDLYGRFSRFAVSALTAQTRIGVTIVVYSALALLLLLYVSVQIYAGVLRQEIASLKRERSDLRETLNVLTGDYVSLASGVRVSKYCENELGMVRVGGKNFEVVAVDEWETGFPGTVALTKTQGAMPSAHRYTLRQTDEDLEQ
jgi:hypothetical protein